MSNQPATTLWDDNIKVTIWRNDKPDGSGFWYETVPGRVYTDNNDQTKTASSFTNGDILKLAELMREAHQWVRNAKRRDKQEAKRAA